MWLRADYRAQRLAAFDDVLPHSNSSDKSWSQKYENGLRDWGWEGRRMRDIRRKYYLVLALMKFSKTGEIFGPFMVKLILKSNGILLNQNIMQDHRALTWVVKPVTQILQSLLHSAVTFVAPLNDYMFFLKKLFFCFLWHFCFLHWPCFPW